MRPMPWPEVPEQTALIARRAFPKGSLAIRLRDELGPVFQDADFIGAFGARGRPGIAPSLLMLVTVLQFVERLTDRQGAAAVAGRIDWKYALSLELDDPGFDDSVLAEFRARLVGSDLARLAFDRLLERCRELGLVKAGGKQRADSTHAIAAVRDLNTMELAGEAVRALLEAPATVAPHFLAKTVDLEQRTKRYGPPVSAWRQPRTAAERDALTLQYGRDGRMLLGAIYAQRGEFAWLRELPQVAMITPLLGDSSRQTKTSNGYSRDDFTIDFDARTATCPQGQTSAHWSPQVRDGIEKIHIAFPQRACRTCDAQPACTSSKVGQRRITVYPREIHELQQATRSAQNSKSWRADYQRRASIEGTMSQAANTVGLRKARYRGIKKVELEHYLGATAINITRLDPYFTHHPLDRTHSSQLIRLHAATTN